MAPSADDKAQRETFDLFDKNSDGTISKEELGIVLRSLGKNPTDAELTDMIKVADINKNGKIEFNEFSKLMGFATVEEVDLVEAFQAFDRDGNGLISAAEYRHVMTSMGEALSEAEVAEIIKCADIDGDGCISYVEFAKLMMEK